MYWAWQPQGGLTNSCPRIQVSVSVVEAGGAVIIVCKGKDMVMIQSVARGRDWLMNLLGGRRIGMAMA